MNTNYFFLYIYLYSMFQYSIFWYDFLTLYNLWRMTLITLNLIVRTLWNGAYIYSLWVSKVPQILFCVIFLEGICQRFSTKYFKPPLFRNLEKLLVITAIVQSFILIEDFEEFNNCLNIKESISRKHTEHFIHFCI